MTGESIYLKRHKTIPIGVIWMGVATAVSGDNDKLIDTDIPAAYGINSFKDERLFIYDGTGAGQTRKIEAYNAGTFTVYDNWTTNPDATSRYQVIAGEGVSGAGAGDATAANQTTIIADVGTVDGKVDTAIDITHEVCDIVIYPAAEDRGTTVLDGDGSSPNYLAESSQNHAAKAAAQNGPAWTEDIDFEQNGTSTILSIFAELRWAHKTTGGGTSHVVVQISGDGSSSWVDLTDEVTEVAAVYADKTRVGVGRWITTIAAGANQLQLRIIQWITGGGTSTEVKLREDSYMRLTYRKS